MVVPSGVCVRARGEGRARALRGKSDGGARVAAATEAGSPPLVAPVSCAPQQQQATALTTLGTTANDQNINHSQNRSNRLQQRKQRVQSIASPFRRPLLLPSFREREKRGARARARHQWRSARSWSCRMSWDACDVSFLPCGRAPTRQRRARDSGRAPLGVGNGSNALTAPPKTPPPPPLRKKPKTVIEVPAGPRWETTAMTRRM